MNKKTFIKIINEYQEQYRLLNIAGDFIDIDSPIITFGWNMFDILVSEAFSETDVEYIYDYLHWNSKEPMEVCDGHGGRMLLKSAEDLWNYLTDFEPDCQTCTNS